MQAYDTDSDPGESRAVMLGMFKGGFGKTPLARELAERLANRGHRVLLIDTDPDGHLSLSFGFFDRKVDGPDLGTVLVDEEDPRTIIRETGHGFGIIPAHNLEAVNSRLNSVRGASDERMRINLVDPLLGDEVDFILIDTPGTNTELVTNAAVAAGNVILPLKSNAQAVSGLRGVMLKLIGHLRHYGRDVNVLAATPTVLNQRIDIETQDQNLLKAMNTSDYFASLLLAGLDGADPENGTLPEGVTAADVADAHVPPFARIPEEDWDRVESGDLHLRPQLRENVALDDAYDARVPLSDHDPENELLGPLDQLADIIEHGGITDEIRQPEQLRCKDCGAVVEDHPLRIGKCTDCGDQFKSVTEDESEVANV